MSYITLIGILGLVAIAACCVLAVVLYRVSTTGSTARKLAVLLIIEGFVLVTAGFPDLAFGIPDSFYELHHFVSTVMQSGCRIFIIHARKAWLDGLSPKQNREIPPLCYDKVYKIKEQFPELEVIINGGIKTIDECKKHLKFVDGMMIGREAYQNPYLLVDFDDVFFQDKHPKPEREEIITTLLPYIENHLEEGGKLQQISRHLLGLFQSVPGAKYWRRTISENAHLDGAGTEVLTSAIEAVQLVKKTNES